MLLPVSLLAQSADYSRGVELCDRGEFSAAVPYLQRAVKAQPNDPQFWKALGVAFAAQGLYAEAEAPLRQACESAPDLLDACYFYARALYALDRFEPSLAMLHKIRPQPWKARVAAGQALEALGKNVDAERELRAALAESQGASPQPGTALGLFLVRQGRFDEAIAPLEDVVQRHPAAAEAHMHLGRALMEQGKVDAAVAHFERAVALNGASAQAHLLLAKAYVRMGRAAEASPHFEAAARGAKQ